MDTPQFPPSPGAPAPTGQAVDAVKLPAIFLIVVACLSIVFALLILAQFATGAVQQQINAAMSNNPNVTAEAQAFAERFAKLGMVFPIVWLILGALMVFGAVQMMHLRNFGLAMAAAIIAVIPCIGSYPLCCLLNLPIGIWALVVLNKPEVRASFT